MSSYEHARLRQIAERELRLRIGETVEAEMNRHLADSDGILDPFSRERLKRLVIRNVSSHIDELADWTAAKTLRRAVEKLEVHE